MLSWNKRDRKCQWAVHTIKSSQCKQINIHSPICTIPSPSPDSEIPVSNSFASLHPDLPATLGVPSILEKAQDYPLEHWFPIF